MAGSGKISVHREQLANGAYILYSLSQQSIESLGGAWRLLPDGVGILKRAEPTAHEMTMQSHRWIDEEDASQGSIPKAWSENT